MLEIRYNIQSKELTGWWGSRHGNHEAKLKDRPDEAIVLIDAPIPDKPLVAWLFDEANQILVDNPNYIPPEIPVSYSSHLGQILAIDVGLIKPIRVRVHHEREDIWKDYDCFVTEGIKDQYIAGTVAVDGWVIIHFFENDMLKPVCTDVIYKSW